MADLTRCYAGDSCLQDKPCQQGRCLIRDRFKPMEYQDTIIQPARTILSDDTVIDFRQALQRALDTQPTRWVVPVPAPTRRVMFYHHCFVCFLVGLLPNHHRCLHGRIECEHCELDAAGW